MNLVRNLLIVIFLFASVSCATPAINTEKFHGLPPTDQSISAPVSELQRLALTALQQKQYEQAIAYLQRAIKIEPRNAVSWHYLARSYWHNQNFQRCQDMIERSYGYSQARDNLDSANALLKKLCEAG